MRKQFDIKYRPQIESGEYKVVTGDDRPVRIISWDKKVYGGRYEIVALVPTSQGDTEAVQLYCPDGTLIASNRNEKLKLFIVTPEPELTEFEKAFDNLAESYHSDKNPDDVACCKEYAAELFSLARKQLQPEIDAEIEKAYKNADEVQYRKGREEALKDLPRWKRIRDNGCVDADGDTYTDCLCILKRGWYQVISSGTKVGGELRYLSIADLEKLPGFEEDEK